MYSIQPYEYVIEFVVTGSRSEVYSMQLYVKHFEMPGWQVRGVQVTTYVINFVMTGSRSKVYSMQHCVIVCDDW